jgi:protein ImuA
MSSLKANIIVQLQKEILHLQGTRSTSNSTVLDLGLETIKNAFPNAQFPLGVVHEFICEGTEDVSASCGFISGILSSLMRCGGACLWISSSQTVFPPSLKSFGIDPHKIIFISLRKEKEILWAIEEALKCDGLAVVVGEIQELSFTVSRRLQLAVEQSRVTGFIIRRNPRNINTTACVARWKIISIPSVVVDDIPGVGFPRWNVELLKIRNGNPGTWQIEWMAGKFRPVYKFASINQEQQRKTG